MSRFLNSTKVSKEQAKDTGIAMCAIMLLIALINNNILFCKIALILLIINMIAPKAFNIVAFFWLGLSNIFGTIMSKILLSIIFIVLVIPMSLCRKIMGKDTLQLKKFKKEKSSVMINRNHMFVSSDIENPY